MEHIARALFDMRIRLRYSVQDGLVFVLATAVALSGCSSRPADKQPKADLQQWFESRWPGAILVVDYEALHKVRDDETCVIEYRAHARVIKDATGCLHTCCGDVCIDKLVDGFRWIKKSHDAPRAIRKGDLFEMQGKKRYAKTEKGWSCEGP